MGDTKKKSRLSAPARTPEEQERKMINLAMEEAERRLMNGTASSQIVTHFLDLATTKHQLELEKLKAENELSRAKADAVRNQGHYDELVKEAILAFKSYRSSSVDDEDFSDE